MTTNPNEKLRAVFLAAVMIVSIFGMSVGFAGTVGASANASVTVTATDGNVALENAYVELTQGDDHIDDGHTDSGEYTFEGLDEGDYTLGVHKDGYVSHEETLGVTGDSEQSVEVSLQLSGNATITVVDGEGDTIDGADVRLVDDGQGVRSDRTNSTGQHTFEGVAPGEYTVWADEDGYFEGETEPFDIDAGENGSGTLQLMSSPANVTGTILNESEDPVKSAWIDVIDTPYGAAPESDGTFHLDVEEDEYTLSINDDDYLAEEIDVDTTDGDVGLDEIELEEPSSTVTGTVVNNETDEPIDSAWVDAINTPYFTSVDGDGEFELGLEDDEYELRIDDDEYFPEQIVVNTTDGDVERGDITLQPLPDDGTLDGTVEDGEGNAIEGATIQVYGIGGTEYDEETATDSDGKYTLRVPEDQYHFRVSADGLGTSEDIVDVTAAETTTENVQLAEPGTLNGTVTADGETVDDATVEIHGPEFDDTETTDGEFEFSVSEGTYDVMIQHDDYADEFIQNVGVNAADTTTVDVSLEVSAYIDGTVAEDNGDPVEGAFVVADDGNDFYFDQTNADGEFNVSASPGEFSVFAFDPESESMATSDGEVTADGGDNVSIDLEMVNPEITHESFEHVGGPLDDAEDLELDANVMAGFLVVNIVDESPADMPHDLEEQGADNTTEFEIDLTVTDFDPSALLWGVKDIEWEATQNETNEDATDITIRTKPVNMQGIDNGKLPIGPMLQQSPADVDWPTGSEDQATVGWNHTVSFGVLDLANVPSETAQNLEGMTIATNAQAFTRPQVRDDTLRVYVAGPHFTVDGEDHDGFYEAHIPDEQLEEWGVDDPETDLNAFYKGDPHKFNVTGTDDGAWIELDINYSDGMIEVSPDVDTEDSTTTSTGSSTVDEPEPTPGVDVTETIEVVDEAPDEPGVRVTSEDTSVSSISFSDELEGEVTISDVTEIPEEVVEPDTEPISSIQVSVPETATDTAATLEVTVDAEVVEESGVDSEALVVNRYVEDESEWQQLETELIGDGDPIVLEAETPGFSYFTVSEAYEEEATPPKDDEPETVEDDEPETVEDDEPEPTDEPESTETDETETTEDEEATTPTEEEVDDMPGFGIPVALIALLFAILARRGESSNRRPGFKNELRRFSNDLVENTSTHRTSSTPSVTHRIPAYKYHTGG